VTLAVTAPVNDHSTPGPTVRRSAYIDTLRAAAIARVFLHHTLWISWLAVLFPSMWVMFSLAGLLVARSLDRGGVTRTVGSRLRRLLPPLWGLALVAVPIMLVQGWLTDPKSPLYWPDLLLWVLPLANPPTSSWAGAFAMALWYLRAYLWFILLSPLLWWLFRRWPIQVTLTPLVAAALMHAHLVPQPTGRIGDVVGTTALYGTAWMLGFARYSGMLEKLSVRSLALIVGGLAVAAAVWGVVAAPADATMFNVQMAEALWGTAVVLVLMRIKPSMDWLARFPRLSAMISALNARAVSIYIWHLPVLLVVGAILGVLGIDPFSMEGRAAALPIGAVLLTLTVAAVGWIEDLAARRRPAIVPKFSGG
jgi:peptidoglycan/LPS O-acetylase OafA/YrhL